MDAGEVLRAKKCIADNCEFYLYRFYFYFSRGAVFVCLPFLPVRRRNRRPARTVTKRVRAHTATFSGTGAVNGHACWNAACDSIFSTSANRSGTSRANSESDLPVGIDFAGRWTSTLVR